MTDHDSLEHAIAFALRHRCPVKLRLGHSDDFAMIGKAIADHLRLGGWDISRKAVPPLGPSTIGSD